ncbi:MAG TPA: flagellar FlbD family protein [Jatrophihabitans sp.]|nr:flagellar FlbD family protein [Jatrophihabitans sp.]
MLRRLNGPLFTLNPDLIERAEATPDTVVTLIGGNKYVIAESLEELVELIRDYRARIIAAAETMMLDTSLGADAQPTTQARMRVLSTTGPGQPVVPFRRNES